MFMDQVPRRHNSSLPSRLTLSFSRVSGMGATEDEIIEMSSKAESARRRLLEKRALQLASAEPLKTKKEERDEILARLDAWAKKNKTKEQKAENRRELQDLRNKSMKVVKDVLMIGADIYRSVMEVVNLMEEVNYYNTASLSAQVAKLEQERDERVNQEKEAKREADSFRLQLQEKTKLAESLHLQLQEAMEVDGSRRVHVATMEQQMQERANQAKEVEGSLRFQLHEEMMKCRYLHSQVAKLEQEKPGKDLTFHEFV